MRVSWGLAGATRCAVLQVCRRLEAAALWRSVLGLFCSVARGIAGMEGGSGAVLPTLGMLEVAPVTLVVPQRGRVVVLALRVCKPLRTRSTCTRIKKIIKNHRASSRCAHIARVSQ